MVGSVTGGTIKSALDNGSIGLEEEGRYFSQKFKAQDTVNIEDARKGLKFFNELHEEQSKNTTKIGKYSIPKHEFRLLTELKNIVSNKEYAIGHLI